MSGATATGGRHAIVAQKLPGDFQHVKAAAAFAGGFLWNFLLGIVVGHGVADS
jgi:hypothetical protein